MTRTCRVVPAMLTRPMGDRSKIEARRAAIVERARTAKSERPMLAAIRCGFCSVKGSEVKHMFAGSNCFICSECIETLSAALMASRFSSP